MDRYDPYTDKFLRDTQYDILGTDLAEVSTDLISRQSVLDAITASINQYGGRYTTEQLNMWGLFVQMIQELPPTQPKRGKWILHTYLPHHNYCSICEKDSPYNKRWNFCPNCGADMRGEQDGRINQQTGGN